ncbi:MAG: hypothetical protein IRY87_12740 [Acetobacteraceae bacterium]|nr:hypothetical protein [Acetobacteraceae bacterium]
MPASRARFHALWLAALLVPAFAFGFAAWSAWQDVRQDAEARMLRAVDVLHEHALRAFQTQEVVLTAIDDHLRGRSWDEIAQSRQVHAFLRRIERSAPTIGGLALVRPDGRLAMTSRLAVPAVPIDFSDRDYVQWHRAGHAGLFLSGVQVTRPHGWLGFVLSLGRTNADGRPDGGTIASSFPPNHFTDFFATVRHGEQDVLALLREDGAILARLPAPPEGTSHEPRPDGPLVRAWRTKASGRGVVRLTSALDGKDRLFAFRSVDPYPAVVVYGLSADAPRAAWLRRLRPIAVVSGLAALLLLTLTALAQRTARREAAALAAAANEAEARAETEARLRQAERVGALGQIAAGIAHDFNNLIQSVSAAALLLDRRADNSDEVRRLAGLVRDAAERGTRVVRRVLDFSRQPPREEGECFDCGAALRRMRGLLAGMLGPGIRLHLDLPPTLPPAQGNRAEFETVILNLAGNARDAMPEGGTIRIAARPVTVEQAIPSPHDAEPLAPGRYLQLTVSDTGTGMPPEVLARVGEPFFTTKPAGKGTGLGLSLARRFADRAGGALRVASRPGEGTAVTLWLREAAADPPATGGAAR